MPPTPRSRPWPPTCARPTSGPCASNLPKAVHVFDHFHVIKLFNDKLSAFRRELYRQLDRRPDQRKLLKGTRWLLLKNPENLDPQRNETATLAGRLGPQHAVDASPTTSRRICGKSGSKPNKATARRVLGRLDSPRRGFGHPHACSSSPAPWRSTATASWPIYDYRISTGPLEGINNKIQTMKRQAYGFRDSRVLQTQNPRPSTKQNTL